MPSATFKRAVAVATTAAATCALAFVPITAASAAVVSSPVTYSAEDASLELTPLGSFETGVFDESAAEIVATHGDRLFVVNAQAGSVSVLDWSDPTAMTELFAIASTGTANSVAVREDGLGVIAFEAEDKTAPGSLVFFDADAADPASAILGSVTVGALPDMVTISADGMYAVVANEGEPADDYTSDPEGSIGVVTLPSTKTAPAQGDVRLADFHAYESDGGKTLPADVRVFGPTPETDFPVSRNLEPEYIAIDGDVAYAALQENNAIAVVDLTTATVQDIWALGFKDHAAEGNGLDASDRDPEGASTINIDTYPYPGLFGMYQPDGMDSYAADGHTFLVTANEGDAREWGDYVEPERVKDLDVCEDSPVAGLTGDEDLGRLEVTTELGFDETEDCYSSLYAHGARSFSIWTTSGTLVFDSGDDFEQITALAAPGSFNFSNDDNDADDFDSRSDAKGPEPEGVVIGEVGERTYAFIGLERVGGVMVYDITTPLATKFVTYINNRDVSVDAESAAAGDLGPEGLAFVAAEDSPTGEPALIVGNEVSGTTTVFGITDLLAPETTEIQVLTINDFHGRLEGDSYGVAGAAVIGGAVADFEAANPNTLFVSAGDNIGGSTFTSASQDDLPSIDALVAAGLDLGSVGNHEFDKGFDFLLDTATPRFGEGDAAVGAKYSLGANVYEKGTENPVLEEYSIEEVDGVRVAFIGTVTPDTAVMVSPDGIADIEFGDQLVAANRVAAELTAGDLADVIILLTHDGAATDSCESLISDDTDYSKLVAGASDDIDAIASGHTHQEYACMLPTPGGGERPVIQALEYGKALGLLEISVNAETQELVSIEGSVVPLTDGGTPLYPADPTVAAIVADAVEQAEIEGSVEIGSITADILRGGTPPGDDRGVESSMGNTLADMYLWAASNDDYTGTPAQIGMINPGGLRADLLYGTDGTVTYRDIANVQPFANTIVTIEVTGAQLKAILEEQWQPEGSSRPKLHMGISEGFTYEYDPDAADGSHIVSMTLEGSAVEDTDTVVVATNSFLAAGGDNFTTFTEGADRTDTGWVDLAASVAYFEEASPIDPAPLGRAVIADDTVEPTPTPTPTDGADEGTDWVEWNVGSGTVEQGGTLTVELTGLTAGQMVDATLYSDPIVIEGIPAANTAGEITFTVAIRADLETGAHTLVLASDGYDDVEIPVTVVAEGSLAATGAETPWGLALAAAFLIVIGGTLAITRRRTTTA